MYELAKKSREAMKAKARRLAGEKDMKVDSSTWSPAAPLNTEVKTGARPIMKPSAKGIGESNAARDTKAAIGNAKRGAYKDGGGVLDKKALGAVEVLPKRGKAENYKKGGKVKKADGGGSWLEKMVGKPKSTSDLSEVGKGKTSDYSAEDKARLSEKIQIGRAHV